MRKVLTALAWLFLLVMLLAPGQYWELTPLAFVRVPIDGLVAVALVLALPPGRARRIGVWAAGAVLGVVAVAKLVGLGFSVVLDRPFDPTSDMPFLVSAVEFVGREIGDGGATIAAVIAVVAALAVLVLVMLSFVRVSGFVVRRRVWAARTVGALGLVWVTLLVTGAQIVEEVPVASRDLWDRADQVAAGLMDTGVFADQIAADRYRDTPGGELLNTLRGKDVVLVLVESYGRTAAQHPDIQSILRGGGERLSRAGFGSRSAYLTSPIAGGGSWLAHATLLSGLWVHNQQRHEQLLASGRLTLNSAFRRAGWRTVGIMPGNTTAWPEGRFFGYDRVYGVDDLGYHGSKYAFGSIPDQYSLAEFERGERAREEPVMATIPLVSSHAPWDPVPELVDWAQIGDGSGYKVPDDVELSADVLARDRERARRDYRHAVGYSLESIVSYVETYGDDNMVLVFLGDHQPAPIITGPRASRDVPITLVAKDPAVLDRVSGWGWQDGLLPGAKAPVWRMDTFRDHFLGTFTAPLVK